MGFLSGNSAILCEEALLYRVWRCTDCLLGRKSLTCLCSPISFGIWDAGCFSLKLQSLRGMMSFSWYRNRTFLFLPLLLQRSCQLTARETDATQGAVLVFKMLAFCLLVCLQILQTRCRLPTYVQLKRAGIDSTVSFYHRMDHFGKPLLREQEYLPDALLEEFRIDTEVQMQRIEVWTPWRSGWKCHRLNV